MEGGIKLFGAPKKRKAKESRDEAAGAEEGRHRKTKKAADAPNSEDDTGGGAGGVAVATLTAAPQREDAGRSAETSGVQDDELTFRDIGVSEWLDAVLRSLAIVRPTPVQRQTIPEILKGRDIIGCAQTGSGKTAAFVIPILQKLAVDPFGVFALVLTPTRELAFQICDQFSALGAGMTLSTLAVIGGLDQREQAKELVRRPHVVVATPGRLGELMRVDPSVKRSFKNTRFLVLDEADRVLDPTFEDDLQVILETVPKKGRQLLLFSATMTQSMEELKGIMSPDNTFSFHAYEGMRTVEQLRQSYIFVPAKVKEVYLTHVLEGMKEAGTRSCIIFAGTTRSCQLIELLLVEMGFQVAALHSNKAQKHRLSALGRFKARVCPILVATDVASRGLDIPTVDLVINFDLPRAPADYVHRVGRTARAGRGGWALSIVSQYDVQLLQRIEGDTGIKMEEYDLEEDTVLKSITRVFKARRAAAMRLVELEEDDQGLQQRLRNKEKSKAERRKKKMDKAGAGQDKERKGAD